jgi:outer membrane protein
MGVGALAVALTFAAGFAAKAESLASALTNAYTHSGLLEQNRAVLRAADEDVAQALAALRPVISWSGDVTRSFGTSRSANTGFRSVGSASNTATIGVLAEITLYDGGSNRLTLDAAKEAVLSTRASLLSVEQQVLFRAVQAFMDIRRTTEIVAISQNNVRVIARELRAARDRFEVGDVTRTDVALAEARLAAAESNLASAEGEYLAAVEEYRAAVGRKPANLVSPTKLPRIPGDVEKAKAIAVRQHPDMIRVQHLVTANELGIAIAEAAMSPTLSLRGSLSVTENFDTSANSRGGSISLRAGGPIYQGGRLTSLVRQAMARRDEARGNLHVVRHNIQQNVGNAYVQLSVARASREASESQVRAATVAFRGVREEATLGTRTTLDVLDAEQELLDARANLISAQVDEMIAAYAVLSSIGELTASALQLKVPQYDPTEYYNLVKNAPPKSKQGEDLDRVLRALGKE